MRDRRSQERNRFPVQIHDTINIIDLKHTAIEKHANHNQMFCAFEDYALLYSDLSEVFLIILISGSTKQFR